MLNRTALKGDSFLLAWRAEITVPLLLPWVRLAGVVRHRTCVPRLTSWVAVAVLFRLKVVLARPHNRWHSILTKWPAFDLAGCGSCTAHPPHPAHPPCRTHARRDPPPSCINPARMEHASVRLTAPLVHILSYHQLVHILSYHQQDYARCPWSQMLLVAVDTPASSCAHAYLACAHPHSDGVPL